MRLTSKSFRVVLFVRACALSGCPVELEFKFCGPAFCLFRFGVGELSFFPFWGDELSLFPSPRPPNLLSTLVGLIGMKRHSEWCD